MLNKICHPDDKISLREHKHICPQCKTCFKHTDEVANSTAEEFDEAHTCPECGETDVTKKVMDEYQILKGLAKLYGVSL